MPWQKLQPSDIHEVVIVVVGGVASVPVKDARVVSHQVLLLRPQVGERFAPDLHTNLPLRCDCPGGKTALDREELRVRRDLFQTKGRFPLADFDVRFRVRMPVNEDVRGGKLRARRIRNRRRLAGC